MFDNSTHPAVLFLSTKKGVYFSYTHEAFVRLKGLLAPFGITRFYTDDWGAYEPLLNQKITLLEKKTPRKLSEKIVPYEHALRD